MRSSWEIHQAEPAGTYCVRLTSRSVQRRDRGGLTYLLRGGAVLIDVDRPHRQAVIVQYLHKAAVVGQEVSSSSFHVPGVLIGHGVVLGNERGKVLPPGRTWQWFGCARWTGKQDGRAKLGTVVTCQLC